MKKSSGITAIKSKTSFPKRMLQKFVNNQTMKAWKKEADKKGHRFSANYELIDWSSVLLPVDGTLQILFEAKHPESISRVSMPVQSIFLVTCIKEGKNDFKPGWICSMS